MASSRQTSLTVDVRSVRNRYTFALKGNKVTRGGQGFTKRISSVGFVQRTKRTTLGTCRRFGILREVFSNGCQTTGPSMAGLACRDNMLLLREPVRVVTIEIPLNLRKRCSGSCVRGRGGGGCDFGRSSRFDFGQRDGRQVWNLSILSWSLVFRSGHNSAKRGVKS